MGKRILTFVFLTLAVLSASCAEKKADPFSVFDGGFYSEITVVFGDGECTLMYDGFKKSAEITAPEELSGFVMSLTNGEPRLLYGNIEVALSEYSGRLAYLCDTVFSENSDSVTQIKARELDGRTVTVVKTDEAEYTFASDGSPLSISGYYGGTEFKITFLSFTGEAK